MNDLDPGEDLPLDLLRSFVAIAEAGSMARAAAVIGRTPSALSLQMRRLGGVAGRPLFRRDGRGITLTDAGARLLPAAREVLAAAGRARRALRPEDALRGPVRLGVVQDFADGPLAPALAAFAARHPEVLLSVQVDRSAALRARADEGALDLVLAYARRPGPRSLRRERMAWLGEGVLAARDPLPLAVLDPPCPFRDAALATLRRAGRRHHLAVTTGSVSVLRAAVAAGLAITCRTAGGLPGVAVLGRERGLPALPEIGWDLHVPRPLSAAARVLSGELRRVVAATGASGPAG